MRLRTSARYARQCTRIRNDKRHEAVARAHRPPPGAGSPSTSASPLMSPSSAPPTPAHQDSTRSGTSPRKKRCRRAQDNVAKNVCRKGRVRKRLCPAAVAHLVRNVIEFAILWGRKAERGKAGRHAVHGRVEARRSARRKAAQP